MGGHVYEEREGKKEKKERETCRIGIVDVQLSARKMVKAKTIGWW